MIENIAPSAGGTVGSAMLQGPGGKMGKEEFLKLLVAQLRHQDPMNPMEGQDFAAQLAQFSSVEQLISLNEGMNAQAGVQGAIVEALNGTMAMGAIGKSVLALGNQVTLPPEGGAKVTFEVGGLGGQATLRILNSAGHEVGTRELGVVFGGRQTVDVGTAAEGLPAGQYTYAVDVVDGAGAAVPTETMVTTRIDGIRYTPAGPVLTGGGMELPFGSILEIIG